MLLGIGPEMFTLIFARHGSLQVPMDIGHNHQHHACAERKQHSRCGPAPCLPSLFACICSSAKDEQLAHHMQKLPQQLPECVSIAHIRRGAVAHENIEAVQAGA